MKTNYLILTENPKMAKKTEITYIDYVLVHTRYTERLLKEDRVSKIRDSFIDFFVKIMIPCCHQQT